MLKPWLNLKRTTAALKLAFFVSVAAVPEGAVSVAVTSVVLAFLEAGAAVLCREGCNKYQFLMNTGQIMCLLCSIRVGDMLHCHAKRHSFAHTQRYREEAAEGAAVLSLLEQRRVSLLLLHDQERRGGLRRRGLWGGDMGSGD